MVLFDETLVAPLFIADHVHRYHVKRSTPIAPWVPHKLPKWAPSVSAWNQCAIHVTPYRFRPGTFLWLSSRIRGSVQAQEHAFEAVRGNTLVKSANLAKLPTNHAETCHVSQDCAPLHSCKVCIPFQVFPQMESFDFQCTHEVTPSSLVLTSQQMLQLYRSVFEILSEDKFEAQDLMLLTAHTGELDGDGLLPVAFTIMGGDDLAAFYADPVALALDMLQCIEGDSLPGYCQYM